MSAQKQHATGAENAAWTVFVLAAIVAVIAFITYMAKVREYDGEPEVALVIFTASLSLAGLGLVPGLILAGIRQLLPALALSAGAVDDADAAADNAHDGGGDAAGGEHLSGDVREPNAGDAGRER